MSLLRNLYSAWLTGRLRHRHLGHEPVDGSIEISDEEADRQSQENVERWVSAHIVPVGSTFTTKPGRGY